jgi:hypothetical protein
MNGIATVELVQRGKNRYMRFPDGSTVFISDSVLSNLKVSD